MEGKLSYRSDKEIGWLPAQDRLYWNVSAAKIDDGDDKNGRGRNVLVNGRVLDSSGKILRRTEDTIKRARDENGPGGTTPHPKVPLRPETLMIAIEPRDNQPPQVVVHGELTVDEGATEILSPDILTVNDSDTRPDNQTVVIVDGPQYGYLEVRDRTGEKKKLFFAETYTVDCLVSFSFASMGFLHIRRSMWWAECQEGVFPDGWGCLR